MSTLHNWEVSENSIFLFSAATWHDALSKLIKNKRIKTCSVELSKYKLYIIDCEQGTFHIQYKLENII